MGVFIGILVVYTIMGAIVFQWIDETIAEEPLHEAVYFTFSTITTIGYGRVVPSTTNGKIFCLIYVFFGVPLSFICIANMTGWLTGAYWTIADKLTGQSEQENTENRERTLPFSFLFIAFLLYLLIGAFLFSFWIEHLPIIDGLYFGFISITTIGFGDLVPSPDNWWHTLALILYTMSGIVIMSSLLAVLLEQLRQLQEFVNCFSFSRCIYEFVKSITKKKKNTLPTHVVNVNCVS